MQIRHDRLLTDCPKCKFRGCLVDSRVVELGCRDNVAAYLRGSLYIMLLLLFLCSRHHRHKGKSLRVIYQSLCHVSRLQDWQTRTYSARTSGIIGRRSMRVYIKYFLIFRNINTITCVYNIFIVHIIIIYVS